MLGRTLALQRLRLWAAEDEYRGLDARVGFKDSGRERNDGKHFELAQQSFTKINMRARRTEKRAFRHHHRAAPARRQRAKHQPKE